MAESCPTCKTSMDLALEHKRDADKLRADLEKAKAAPTAAAALTDAALAEHIKGCSGPDCPISRAKVAVIDKLKADPDALYALADEAGLIPHEVELVLEKSA